VDNDFSAAVVSIIAYLMWFDIYRGQNQARTYGRCGSFQCSTNYTRGGIQNGATHGRNNLFFQG